MDHKTLNPIKTFNSRKIRRVNKAVKIFMKPFGRFWAPSLNKEL